MELRAFLAARAALVVVLLAAAAAAAKPRDSTPERQAILLTLAKGQKYNLRLPRLLANPVTGGYDNTFVRTYNDTCGLYGIAMKKTLLIGKGADSHVHFADEEFFLPTTPGDVVRLYAQADTSPLRIYKPGQVPGWTVPSVTTVGHLNVTYGQIGYSPMGIPHVFRAVNDMTNMMAIWLNGYDMIPSVNLPFGKADASEAMYITSMWGTPTDITNGMLGGKNFMRTSLAFKAAIPPTSIKDVERLQAAFDAGEACYPK